MAVRKRLIIAFYSFWQHSEEERLGRESPRRRVKKISAYWEGCNLK